MIVGLTGGIGSGKSYVATLFKNLGVPIYISDIKAKDLMHNNAALKLEIISLFGSKAYIENNLNRKWVAKQVFSSKERLEALNAIVHPAVAKDFKEWYTSQKFDFVIQESALLFETGSYKKCDKIILVTAPKDLRIDRVVKRDNTSVEAVKSRMQNQFDDSQRIPLSNFIIDNVNRSETIIKVSEIYKILMNKK